MVRGNDAPKAPDACCPQRPVHAPEARPRLRLEPPCTSCQPFTANHDMEKGLPLSGPQRRPFAPLTRPLLTRRVLLPSFVALSCFLVLLYGFAFGQGIQFWEGYTRSRLSPQAATAVARCRALHAKPGPSPSFASRSQSDRFVPGTKPYLLKNARIWTGEKNGTEVLHADVLLDKGLIKGIGQTAVKAAKAYKDDIVVVDVKGSWVTPG